MSTSPHWRGIAPTITYLSAVFGIRFEKPFINCIMDCFPCSSAFWFRSGPFTIQAIVFVMFDTTVWKYLLCQSLAPAFWTFHSISCINYNVSICQITLRNPDLASATGTFLNIHPFLIGGLAIVTFMLAEIEFRSLWILIGDGVRGKAFGAVDIFRWCTGMVLVAGVNA